MILEPRKIESVTASTCFPLCLPWNDGTECHDLSFLNVGFLSHLFHSPLSPSSKGSLFPLHFVLEQYYLHTWGCWYFSWQSWFQLVIYPAPGFWMMYSAHMLNKQGNNIQPCCTPFPVVNPCPSCSLSGSNCCFLTCIQVSQETGKVVWYSYLFKNFPQSSVNHYFYVMIL